MFCALRTQSIMKCSVIFVLFLSGISKSHGIECGQFVNTIESNGSLEFYCLNFKGNVPVNCSVSFSTASIIEKSKVTQLKIGGCDNNRIKQLIDEFKNLHSLDISQSEIESLDSLELKHDSLEKISASNNKLKEIPAKFFVHLPAVNDIDFLFNELIKIEKLPRKLVKINLSHNNFTSLPKDVFVNLVPLQYLDLSFNAISTIGFDQIFADHNKLKTLRLEKNQIDEFDWRFFPIVKRSSVVISWDEMVEFRMMESLDKPMRIVVKGEQDLTRAAVEEEQKNIAGQEKRTSVVESKDLSQTTLIKEDLVENEGLFQAADGTIELHCRPENFKAIKKFEMHNNYIENPKELLRCLTPSLEVLKLTGSCTEKMASVSLEPFKNLTKLTLVSMLVDFDVAAIKSRKNLFELDISKNNLTTISNAQFFNNVQNLSLLNIQGNRIENTPEMIQHLPSNINILKLNGNFVGKLNATTFERFKNLKILNLSNTHLSFDNLKPFEAVELEELHISHNDLENANFQHILENSDIQSTSTAFKVLQRFYAADCKIKNVSKLIPLFGSSLSHLDLSGNDFGAIDARTFENVENLNLLNLSNTNLTSFDFSTVAHEIELVSLDLSNNKLENIDMSTAPKHLQTLYLNGNDLKEIVGLERKNVPRLSYLRINGNQLSCEYLSALMSRIAKDWPRLRLLGDSWDQKHKEMCVF